MFAVTGDDSHNLMVAMSVKLMRPQVRVVVRRHDIHNANKASRAGADEIVSPDFTGGMRIASAMVRPHVVSFLDQMLRSDEGLRVEEVVIPDDFSSTPLGILLPPRENYLLMATRESGAWVFNPPSEQLATAGSVLVLMTNPDGRAQVEKLLHTPEPTPHGGAGLAPRTADQVRRKRARRRVRLSSAEVCLHQGYRGTGSAGPLVAPPARGEAAQPPRG
ncbi:MAG: NAD-binding protein [Burkholderiales bacterium]|nr:NAD-binding protein [Burkholderiales bacterium]